MPRGVDVALSRFRARVTVHAPAEEIRARVPDSVRVDPLDATRCTVHAGADTPDRLALHLLMLDADFEVDGPPELLASLHTLATRTARANQDPGRAR